jgi:hypothetical protein
MQTTQVKLITLAEALKLKDEQQLFVKNRVLEVKGNSGNITMTVRSNGTGIGMSIPDTWIPFDLTVYVARADILAEPNFRRLVQQGVISIVDTESAIRFMEAHSPKTDRELNRILNVNSEVENDMAKAIAAESSLEIKVPGAQANTGEDLFIEAIVSRAETEVAADIISELDARIMGSGVTLAQLQFIMDNVTSPEIKDWCVENLDNASDK